MRGQNIAFILLVILITPLSSYGQAKKPTLMILPSDNWCEQRYFMTEFNNQGIVQKVPNYKQAFQEDTEIGQVISKIGSLMIDRGFPLKDAEQEIKSLEIRRAEDNMTMSKTSGTTLSESPLDILKTRAKADIIVQIWWKVSNTSDGRIISFVLEAFDAYTSKRIAASSGNGEAGTEIVPVLLERAILNNLDPFVNQLQGHFSDLITNGREIRLGIRTWENWEYDLEAEFDNVELRDIIYDWVQVNSVEGRFNETNSSEYRIDYEQLRIPIYDERGRALDARQYARGLVKFLNASPYNFEIKLLTRGLGEAILVLGEK